MDDEKTKKKKTEPTWFKRAGILIIPLTLLILVVGSRMHGCVGESQAIEDHIKRVLSVHKIGRPDYLRADGFGGWWIYRCVKCEGRWAGDSIQNALEDAGTTCKGKGEF